MEKKFAYNYIQDPTSQQGFNRYAYCFYNPLKYVDPSGYRCDDPPYWQQVQQYLTCMNRENAECLNAVGITHVQVNSSSGYSGSYVMYDVAGESYGYHYNGYVDTGYHDGYGGQTTYSDGSLPTPPTPMYWNEGGGCGGGASSSGGGFSHPVVPVDGRNQNASNDFFHSEMHDNIVGTLSFWSNMCNSDTGKAFAEECAGFGKLAKFLKYGGWTYGLISEGIDAYDYISGNISFGELSIKTAINAIEVFAPVLGPIGIAVSVIVTSIDAGGGFDVWIYDKMEKP